MYTYQDLQKIVEKKSDSETMKFVYEAILKHEGSDDFKIAKDAIEYYKQKNTTIRKYERILYEVTGKAVKDDFSPNYKLASNFFYRFVTQENQYLLGNGVTFDNKRDAIKDKLGTVKYDFDKQLQKLGKYALVEKAAFGFWNLDHIDVFEFVEFVPLFDEETGMLRSGIRYWQLDKDKPLRATLYEEDGYTEYKWENKTLFDGGEIIKEKTAYIIKGTYSEADGFEITDGKNYPSFPIVPLWANDSHQSSIIGIREQIDCYDLIKGGFANTVDEASIIYWTLQNAGGMDDVDLREFIDRLSKLHATTVDDDVKAESHTIEAPYQSREALLDRLRADLYEDAMALDTKALASGGSVVTAVIKAAYEPLNNKVDDYEYCVRDFIDSIMELAGVEGEYSFTRSKLINQQEDIAVIISAGEYLPHDYITEKILTILGDGDQLDEVLKQLSEEELSLTDVEVTEQNSLENNDDLDLSNYMI